MKLAYIASNANVKNSLASIAEHYSEVDLYFLENMNQLPELIIDDLPKLVDNLNIPAVKDFLTFRQKQVSNKLSQQTQNLLSNIYTAKNIPDSPAESTNSIKFSKFNTSEIVFIKYNREIKKFSIENSKNEIVEYDLLLIENNQFVMRAILDKQQNLFNAFAEQDKCWLNLVYETKNLHKYKQQDKSFIFIEDSNIGSLDDNWYVMKIESNMLTVTLLVPYEMQNDQQYLDFLNERIIKMLNKRFISYQIVKLNNTYVLPIDGYFSYKAKLRQAKQAALVPSFYFWNESKVRGFLNNLLKQKSALNTKSESLLKKGSAT